MTVDEPSTVSEYALKNSAVAPRTALARSKKYVTPIIDVESRVVKSFDWLFDLNLEGGTPTWIRSDVFGYESPTGSMVRKATRI